MIEEPLAGPDITLTIDAEGVIRSAVCSDALLGERLDGWRGRLWSDTVAPEAGLQVSRIIEQARRGVSACLQVNQRMPSGRELPLEYTTISLGDQLAFVAVGKNLQTISDLQSRLALAQQAREQDYWKLRDVETRYRAVLDASSEAVALVRASNMRVVEANVAATRSLGLVPGGEFLPDMAPRERRALDTMLAAVRAEGRAPGVALRLSAPADHWSLRASHLTSDTGSFYLFQMSALSAISEAAGEGKAPSVEDIVQRLPEGFVIVDRAGNVQKANDTFLDMAQLGAEGAALGQNLSRWLSRPGADSGVILSIAQSHGVVRKMATAIEGEMGLVTEVEISATGERTLQPNYIGLLIQEVKSRGHAGLPLGADRPDDMHPGASLDHIVKTSIEAIERRSIVGALSRTEGNRTKAAKSLGLSRQSLHTKLNKYKINQA